MNVKSVGLEKLEEIVTLNTEIFTPLYAWPPFTLSEYQERLAGKQPYVLVAKENGVLVGNSISFERDGYWYIWILGVAPEHRNKGIATQLFQENENYARSLEHNKIRVKVYDVSKEMLNLVAKRGYDIIDTIESLEPKYKAFIVELEL